MMGQIDAYDVELAPSLWAGKALAIEPGGGFVEIALGRGGLWRDGLRRAWEPYAAGVFRRVARSTGPRRLVLHPWQPWVGWRR
jgi:hypothetical protein